MELSPTSSAPGEVPTEKAEKRSFFGRKSKPSGPEGEPKPPKRSLFGGKAKQPTTIEVELSPTSSAPGEVPTEKAEKRSFFGRKSKPSGPEGEPKPSKRSLFGKKPKEPSPVELELLPTSSSPGVVHTEKAEKRSFFGRKSKPSEPEAEPRPPKRSLFSRKPKEPSPAEAEELLINYISPDKAEKRIRSLAASQSRQSPKPSRSLPRSPCLAEEGQRRRVLSLTGGLFQRLRRARAGANPAQSRF